MADITPVNPGIAGTLSAGVACAAGGDAIVSSSGECFALINNGSGGSINVTIIAQQTTRPAEGAFPAMTLASQVVTVGAGAAKIIGPFNAAFIDANGKVQLTYSGVTTLTISAFKFKP